MLDHTETERTTEKVYNRLVHICFFKLWLTFSFEFVCLIQLDYILILHYFCQLALTTKSPKFYRGIGTIEGSGLITQYSTVDPIKNTKLMPVKSINKENLSNSKRKYPIRKICERTDIRSYLPQLLIAARSFGQTIVKREI